MLRAARPPRQPRERGRDDLRLLPTRSCQQQRQQRADVVGDRVQRLAVAGDRVRVTVEAILQHAPAFDAQVGEIGTRRLTRRGCRRTRVRGGGVRVRQLLPVPASGQQPPQRPQCDRQSGIGGERPPRCLEHLRGRPVHQARRLQQQHRATRGRRGGRGLGLVEPAIGARILFGGLRHRLTHFDDVRDDVVIGGRLVRDNRQRRHRHRTVALGRQWRRQLLFELDLD